MANTAFIIYILFPFFAWNIKRRYFKDNHVKTFLLTALIGSLLYVTCTWLVGIEYEIELDKYDLNGDGFFSGDELTTEQAQAMKKVSNDTGRTYAPIVAGPATLIWVAISFSICSIISGVYSKLLKLVKNNKTT